MHSAVVAGRNFGVSAIIIAIAEPAAGSPFATEAGASDTVTWADCTQARPNLATGTYSDYSGRCWAYSSSSDAVAIIIEAAQTSVLGSQQRPATTRKGSVTIIIRRRSAE